MTNPPPILTHSLNLLNHEQEVRDAQNLKQLSYLMVNRGRVLMASDIVIYWQKNHDNSIEIKRVSNIPEFDKSSSPLIQQLNRLIRQNVAQFPDSLEIIPDSQTAELELTQFYHWSHSSLLWCPLKSYSDSSRSGLIFIREKTWGQENFLLAKRLSEMYGYATHALSLDSPSSFVTFTQAKKITIIVGFLFFSMFLPIHQSIIAPTTVIAQNPDIVTAPLDGVIETITVAANEQVSKGQVLVEFEKSVIENRYQVAQQVLNVAEAKYLKAQQLSFNNNEIKAQLALLKAQMEQHRAEVEYTKQLLSRTQLRSARDGIAIIDDVNKLIGKPVQTGEKILTVADPNQVELEIQLPVEDAIIMNPGALVELFLNTSPDRALIAEISYVGYTANITANGFLAYRLLATLKLTDNQLPPRIGLKGSAKIYGPKVTMFYYLFRRPLSILRQTLGI